MKQFAQKVGGSWAEYGSWGAKVRWFLEYIDSHNPEAFICHVKTHVLAENKLNLMYMYTHTIQSKESV